MKERTRSRLITVFALSGAFVVMMATLAYNPAKTDFINVHIYGKVTDENNTPILAEVFFYGLDNYYRSTVTNDQGQYSITLGSENYSLSTIVRCRATGLGTWTQTSNFTYGQITEIEQDYMLANGTYLDLPLGPNVLASTLPGLTQVNISIILKDPYRFSFNMTSFPCGDRVVSSYGNITFQRISDNGSLTIQCAKGYFSGSYSLNNEILSNLKYHLNMNSVSSRNVSYNKTQSKDYLNPEDVASRSTFYDLTLGDKVTITAFPKYNVTLPMALSPEIDCDVLGTVIESGVNCTYDYFQKGVWDYVPDDTTCASITITPLTSGNHHYQVYIEQDFIIHVWELTN